MSAILNKLVDLARNINGQVDGLLAGAQKTDAIFIVGFIIAAIFFSLVLKRKRVIIFSLAIYVVTALYLALPFDWGMRFGNSVWIFLIAVLAVFLLLKSTIASSFYNSGGGDYSGRVKLILLSVITLGFLVSSALNFVTDFSILGQIGLVNKIFSGETSRGVWAVLPLIDFFFLRK